MYNREWDWAARRGGGGRFLATALCNKEVGIYSSMTGRYITSGVGVTIFIFSVTHFLNVPLGVEKWIRLDSE